MTTTWKQVGRFARLFAFGFVSQLALVDIDHWDRSALLAALVAGAEVVFRHVAPADKATNPDVQ